MRDSFIFYRSFAEAMESIPAEQYKEVMVAVSKYALDGIVPQLDGIGLAMFTLIKPQLDANERRRQNGKLGASYGQKGGRPKKENPKETPKKPLRNPKQTPCGENETPNVNDNDNVNHNDNVKDIYSHRYESEFDDLWSRYPRKQGKSNALKSYIKARKSGVSYEEVSQGLDNYNHYLTIEKTEQRYIKQGSTWFGQGCWNDDYVSKHNWTTADVAPMMSFEEFMV